MSPPVLAKMRKTRRERIFNVVAPLISEGATLKRICEVTGLSMRICCEDAQIARELFQEDFDQRVAEIRGELAAKHNRLFELAINDYHNGAGTRALETAGKQLDSLARIYGVAGGINLHAHNHSHSVTVTAEAVGDLFKPLDAGTYSEMVAARPLPPSEATELPEIDVEAEAVGTDDWGSAKVHEGVPSAEKLRKPDLSVANGDQPGASQGQNRRIQHPMR